MYRSRLCKEYSVIEFSIQSGNYTFGWKQLDELFYSVQAYYGAHPPLSCNEVFRLKGTLILKVLDSVDRCIIAENKRGVLSSENCLHSSIEE